MKLLDTDVPVFKIIAAAIVGIAALALIGVVGSAIMTAGKVASTPARVISKTFETDNVIHNYEWFHDTNGAYRARLGQIKAHAKILAGETDARERQRLNMELAAMQQSCRDLVTRYNANATKTNRSIFMGKEAPESLAIETCEVS